jgi:hypothetical protein
MSSVDPKKPQSWSSLAHNIYQDLPSDAAPPVARPRQTPEQAREALQRFLREAAERRTQSERKR